MTPDSPLGALCGGVGEMEESASHHFKIKKINQELENVMGNISVFEARVSNLL